MADQTLKNITRIVEKAVLNPISPGNANRVFDVVRGMVVCPSLETIAEVVTEFIQDTRIQLVRMKERFFQEISPGGWRDCMLCFVISGEEPVHVCEVQIVHHDLLMARKGLPGHAVYNHARNAGELLEVMWKGHPKYFSDSPWTGACFLPTSPVTVRPN